MSELQVPTLRRSQRISVSQARSRSATPTPAPTTTTTKRSAPKEAKRAASRVSKPTGKTSKTKQKGSASKDTSTTTTAPPTTTSIAAPPPPPPPRSPRVDRLYTPNTWSSTPASLPFLTHGALPTTPSTTTLTLNILDYAIRPTHWNPLLSANKLSAASFFFASVLSGNPVSATMEAGSAGWCHWDYVAALARGNAAGVGEVLRVLDVGREEVVRGYGVLMGMREGLRGVVGEFEGRLEGMPGEEEVRGWEEREKEEGERHAREVRVRMRGLGFVSGKRDEEEEDDVEEEEEESGGLSGLEEERKKDAGKRSVPLIEVELEDFEDFVAENE